MPENVIKSVKTCKYCAYTGKMFLFEEMARQLRPDGRTQVADISLLPVIGTAERTVTMNVRLRLAAGQTMEVVMTKQVMKLLVLAAALFDATGGEIEILEINGAGGADNLLNLLGAAECTFIVRSP